MLGISKAYDLPALMNHVTDRFKSQEGGGAVAASHELICSKLRTLHATKLNLH